METEPRHRRFGKVIFVSAAIFFLFLTNPTYALEALDMRALERSRDLIAQKKVLHGIAESTMVEYFQSHPDALAHDLRTVVRELNAQPRNFDTTKHVRLIPPKGTSGYEDLRIFVSHPYQISKKIVPADNLVTVLIDSIQAAKKEIALNVYEFDLTILADELIKAHLEKKISVHVAVDAKPLKSKPGQRALLERLRINGVNVSEVNSTGINHQKMIAIDWTLPANSRAVFSSGNFTRSCLDSKGDLGNEEISDPRSIPNANHIITMKSWLAANLIHHEITKTTATGFRLRGRSYPTSGAYQITGPGVDPQIFEAYPENSFIIAFTPGGGYRAANRNILAHLILKSKGPIRMTQFAFSSFDVADALLKRAERDLQLTGKFDFQSVGDTPFAMQGWSQFLKISAMKRVSIGHGKNKRTTFVEDMLSPWRKSLTEEQLNQLRNNIRIGPTNYGTTRLNVDGMKREVTAKVHHKIMSMGSFAVIGTSFNFSEGAEGNNEQLLVFNDPKMAAVVSGITAKLAGDSPRSVFEEANRRSARSSWSKPKRLDESLVDSEIRDSEAEIAPGCATP